MERVKLRATCTLCNSICLRLSRSANLRSTVRNSYLRKGRTEWARLQGSYNDLMDTPYMSNYPGVPNQISPAARIVLVLAKNCKGKNVNFGGQEYMAYCVCSCTFHPIGADMGSISAQPACCVVPSLYGHVAAALQRF